MIKLSNFKTISRVAVVVGAVTAIVGGVTFASLQSQQALLKGNTIQTALASLQLSSDGTTFGSSINGYTFYNLIPGGSPAPTNGYPVYLRNVGSTPLGLKLSLAKPITNPDNVDLSKVHLILSPMPSGAPQNIILQDLVSAGSNGVALTSWPRLVQSQTVSYTMQVSMESDAITAPTATLSDIDLNFGATAVN
jgi:hypothetical protein